MTDATLTRAVPTDPAATDRDLSAEEGTHRGITTPTQSSGRHRYTGPELSALLNQVRRELGAEASIVEANRVRSGGIAGFFARESYEVVAAPAEHATSIPMPPAVPPPPAVAEAPVAESPSVGVSSTVEPAPAAMTSALQPVRVAATPLEEDAAATSSSRPSGPTGDISIALLERAEAISALERVSTRQHLDDAAEQRPSSPARFGEVLDAELATGPKGVAHEGPPVTDHSIDLVGEPTAEVEPVEAAPVEVQPVGVEPVGVDLVPAPAASPPAEASPGDVLSGEPRRGDAGDGDSLPVDVVWASEPSAPPAAPWSATAAQIRIDGRADTEPPEPPVGGKLMTIIGRVDAATAVARRLIAGQHNQYAELVVVTPEPETVVDVPADRVGRHYESVTTHLFGWAVRGESGIIVVDAELGDQLPAEVECLRNLGADSIVVVDDRRAPAIETLQLLGALDRIEGTVVVPASAADDPVIDG